MDELKDVEDEMMEVVNGYTCGECGLAFTALKDLNIHQDKGNHEEKLTDHVKMFCTSKCGSIKRNVTKSSFTGFLENARRSLVKGWALKRERISKRFTKYAKDFVCQMFTGDENTGHKYTPVLASKKIRAAWDENGNRIFSPEEWLSSQQVQGLFCRLSQKIILAPDTEEPDEDLNEIIQEINRQENATNLINSICM